MTAGSGSRPAADVDLSGLEELSGYSDADQYLATRFRQGGRDVYCIDFSLSQLVTILPKPDPAQGDGDPRLDPRRVSAFAEQVRTNADWGAPPLLLRAPPDAFSFEPRTAIAGTAWGVLTLPRLVRSDLRIVDGAHRILGFHLAFDGLTADIDSARGKLATLKRQGAAETQRQQEQVSRLAAERQRLAAERIAAQIVVAGADEPYEPFLDGGEGAPGIMQTVLARLWQPKGVASPMHLDKSVKAVTEGKQQAERERDEALAERDRLQQRLADAEQKKQKLDEEHEALRQQFGILAASARPAAPDEAGDAPPEITSVAEAVEAAQALPGLRFLDNAVKTAKESPYEQPAEVYRAFVVLSNLAANHDNIGMSVEDWLRLAGVTYAPHLGHEGSLVTFRNRKYTFDIDGTATLMREHLKFGVDREPRYCLRVYMKWHGGEWVIGHAGKHL